jgi:hypothetical protein
MAKTASYLVYSLAKKLSAAKGPKTSSPFVFAAIMAGDIIFLSSNPIVPFSPA